MNEVTHDRQAKLARRQKERAPRERKPPTRSPATRDYDAPNSVDDTEDLVYDLEDDDQSSKTTGQNIKISSGAV